MKEHNEKTLQKWAQKRLNDLRWEFDKYKTKTDDQIENLKMINAIVDSNKHWFVIQGPPIDKGKEYTHLWIIHDNDPRRICSIGNNDVLFIGRGRG
ncbi:MAG: hypothetical protein A2Y66_01685 [Nitrospirae bacterium RBG_13_41_22]|nr:MAG: hypothetical protein A2Y66_01685 [Nitrospirae bacterium RBG_13_41_22]